MQAQQLVRAFLCVPRMLGGEPGSGATNARSRITGKRCVTVELDGAEGDSRGCYEAGGLRRALVNGDPVALRHLMQRDETGIDRGRKTAADPHAVSGAQ